MEQAASIRGRFRPGVSGNPRGRISNARQQASVEAKARELATALGGFDSLSATERAQLEIAAALLLRRPADDVNAVRLANAASRIIATLERRRGKAKPAHSDLPSVAELMRRGRHG
jgi:hypothetical protein